VGTGNARPQQAAGKEGIDRKERFVREGPLHPTESSALEHHERDDKQARVEDDIDRATLEIAPSASAKPDLFKPEGQLPGTGHRQPDSGNPQGGGGQLTPALVPFEHPPYEDDSRQ
jgi:hypothetical protein